MNSCFSFRSARLSLHPGGDLYVHGETAPVYFFGRDAGETALRHPLPRGPTQRLRRLDNRIFPPMCPKPRPHPWPLFSLHPQVPGLRQTLCSAALTSHKVNFITFSVAMLCLSLLYIAVYTNCTFHYFDLFCFFFSSCYCILFFIFSREFREDILNWHWHGVWGRRWSEPTVRLFVHLFLPFPLTEGLTRFSQILWI